MSGERAGRLIKQPTGYSAFVPAPLPPTPPIALTGRLMQMLSAADMALGRLDGAGAILPNPDLFVAMYVRQEAVYSSQIEGTQSSLEDILKFESGTQKEQPKDIEEVVNYVRAMNYGLQRLQEFPLSLRLIREIHERLMQGVRGGNKQPGEFRTSQNWIGSRGATLANASYVPPPAHEMKVALANLEEFIHSNSDLPPLIHCGVVHAQFETIHPFLDGNGRVGRLLITFLLCQKEILHLPLLYLSHFFKRHRELYYEKLMNVRLNGDWEGWLEFFLEGVSEVSKEAAATAKQILELQEEHRRKIRSEISGATNGMVLLDFLFKNPIITVRMAEQHLNCAYVTAGKIIEKFVELGLLRETTGTRRNRIFRYEPYLQIFAED
ncbi:MAG: Fic family protein [Candidatus Obscuribacterales bacterium]|nr:Fic family protein [Candidatus Obscuribacterales bacterium]